MIKHILDTLNALLHIRPKSSLEQAEFESLAKAVAPFISSTIDLAGLIIETPAFLGWSSSRAFAAHIRFVKDHHKHIRKIALVTDSGLGNLAKHLVAHFVSAEIKQFPSSEFEPARQWILNLP